MAVRPVPASWLDEPVAAGARPDQPAASSLPVGTVTLLLTDVAGSTKQWEATPESMREAVARHYEILDEVIGSHDGVRPVEQGEGDSVVGAFSLASDAVAAAIDLQRQFRAERWPDGAELAVRVAIHTGEAELRDEGNYFGTAVIRCARLRAIAGGGQTLVSGATAEVVRDRLPEGAVLADLGVHRLKDLGRAEHVWGLVHPDLPDDFEPLRSLDNLPNNLPVQLTSFVGRDDELAELRDAVAATRLLTLNGAGGCGKTRLALQLAADVLERYPGGCWFAELATVGDPDRVVATIASALGERDLSGELVEVIVNRLGERATLVIIDNCEHLLQPVAAIVDTLLRRCAALTVVATSREPLGVPGEAAWRVPSLSVPAVAPAAPLESLAQFDAVRLFVERAVKARPNFKLTAENASAVAGICHRLDGIPLAIELAAARVRGMTVEQVAAGLDDRFRLLTGGARTVLQRQQTLQASVDWSYELLSDAEQAVFRRLAVFAGGFTLDAAEAVVAGEHLDAVEVLDLLLTLVDKSIVLVDEERGRYGMLETLRQYGTARLVDAGETKDARDRQLAWATTLFDPIAELAVGDLRTGMRRAEEVGNLRVAFEWASLVADVDAARIVATTLMIWESNSGDAADAAAIGARVLAMPGGQVRFWCLVAATQLFACFEAGDFETSAVTAEELVERIDALDPGDAKLRLYCRRMTAFSPSRLAISDEFIAEGMREAEDAGEQHSVDLYASMLATRQAYAGDWREAEANADRVQGDPATTVAGRNAVTARAIAAMWTGRFEESRAYLDELEVGHVFDAHPRLVAYECAVRTFLDLAQGRDTGAAEQAAALIADARRRRFVTGVALAGWAPGAWALGRGDVETAVREFHAWRAETLEMNLGGIWAVIFVSALLADGHVDDARVELARPQPGPTMARWALRDSKVSALAGCIARAEGDIVAAERHLHEALAAQHQGGWRPDVVYSLEALAGIAAVNESHIECARLAGAAQARRDAMGYVLRWPYEQRLLDGDLASARAALGDEGFDAAFAEGRALDEDAAVAYVQRARGERKRPTVGWESLTPTEAEVVRLVAQGLTNKQIGEQLLMGAETVKTHLAHVYDKLGVRSRTALAVALGARGDPPRDRQARRTK